MMQSFINWCSGKPNSFCFFLNFDIDFGDLWKCATTLPTRATAVWTFGTSNAFFTPSCSVWPIQGKLNKSRLLIAFTIFLALSVTTATIFSASMSQSLNICCNAVLMLVAACSPGSSWLINSSSQVPTKRWHSEQWGWCSFLYYVELSKCTSSHYNTAQKITVFSPLRAYIAGITVFV